MSPLDSFELFLPGASKRVPVFYVDSQIDFESVSKQWLDLPLLAIDTEFERRTTYFAKLALLQVFDGQAIYLIDPLELSCTDSFKQVMISESTVKILHSCKEDLEVLYTEWGCRVEGLFDTQVAYQFINQELSIGYAKLVETLTNDAVDKEQTKSDWTKRPLTDKQLKYAAIDVLYLVRCFTLLNEELTDKSYRPFFEQECKELCVNAAARADNLSDYRDANDVWHLDAEQLALFKALFDWREKVARTDNRTKNHIIRDQGLVEIAQRQPSSITQIKKINDIHPRSIRLYSEQWLTLIQAHQKTPFAALEVVVDPRNVDVNKQFSQKIESIVKQVAKENELLTTALLSKRIIRKLGYALLTGAAPPAAWSGWRKKLLSEPISRISKQFVN